MTLTAIRGADVVEAYAPRVYLLGFPKSGLHLAELWASAYAQPISREHPWAGTVSLHGWGSEVVNVERTEKVMRLMRPGMYAKGHMTYDAGLEQMLYGLGVATVFIYRDLRDVAVSQVYHILSADESNNRHPGKEKYQALGTFEDILAAVITGLDEFPGVVARWEHYAGWLQRDWVMPLKYEDAINDPRPTAEAFTRYLLGCGAASRGETLDVPDELIYQLSLEVVRRGRETWRSSTYRKGKTGAWRTVFGPRMKALWKEYDPGWLVSLGYERNEDW